MGLDFLQNLLGGGQQRQEYGDFVNRYDQGPPHEGYSNQEVLNRYSQVAPQLPPDVYQQSAQEAFARMSPQERQEFARYLQQRSQQQGLNFPDFNQDGIDDRYQDPQKLAEVTSRMEQQQPGILGQLLGGRWRRGQHARQSPREGGVGRCHGDGGEADAGRTVAYGRSQHQVVLWAVGHGLSPRRRDTAGGRFGHDGRIGAVAEITRQYG